MEGCLILWKKNLPDVFKTAEDLVITDRGGFIFEPEIGIHENIIELDYASLYPNIMVRYNISPETILCGCCKEKGRKPPEINHWICVRRLGLIPRVLKPLIERKRYYKRKRREDGPLKEVYAARDTILKWLLVTCLHGDTQLIVRKEGRYRIMKIRDIVEQYTGSREGLAVVSDDLRVFGYSPDLVQTEKRVVRVIKAISPPELLRLRLEGGREIIMTSNHRCLVLGPHGELLEKRADELTEGDYMPISTHLQLQEVARRTITSPPVLFEGLPKRDLPLWRIRGEPIKREVMKNYDNILKRARQQGYAYRTIRLWRKQGIVPLQFLDCLSLQNKDWKTIEVGRGHRGGGRISFLPAECTMDGELAFLLGFYVGDGSGTGNMVRLNIGMREPEVVEKLMDCIFRKFGILGQIRKEKKVGMRVLQFNSSTLPEIIRIVFGFGPSAERGKLQVSPVVLNGDETVRRQFIAGLLASDGFVGRFARKASLYTTNLGFLHQVGLLLSTFGIKYRIYRDSRILSLNIRPSELKNGFWLKDYHRGYLLQVSTERGEGDIPIRSSGLFNLCTAFRSSHQLPQRSNARLSRKVMSPQIRKLEDRIPESDATNLTTLRNLKLLAESDLSFLRVTSIKREPAKDPFVYCLEVADDLHAFVIEGGILTGNCFGYQGYRNARFGRIECHEAINAYGRELMVRSMEIAEAHGYEVVHGIVDSLWLRAKEGAEDLQRLIDHLSGYAGIPVDLEGVYKWIVFLPCKTTGVGALNRYYGLLQNGEMKIRGIEVRKHDTPEFINQMQDSILQELKKANNAEEFKECIPRALDIIRRTAKELMDDKVSLRDLILTKVVTKKLDDYVVLNNTVAALKQMQKRGFSVEPGEYIR